MARRPKPSPQGKPAGMNGQDFAQTRNKGQRGDTMSQHPAMPMMPDMPMKPKQMPMPGMSRRR